MATNKEGKNCNDVDSNYTFLYPRSRQFPVDEVCSLIVNEIEKRNWTVPGIEIEFGEYGTGDRKFRYVQSLKSKDFKLSFCRVQGRLGSVHNDVAAINEIVIPKKQLDLYDDESGPTFYMYVGNDWKNDCDWFMSGSKVNSKLREEPRRYLRFKGGWKRPKEPGYQFMRSGQRAPYIVHDNDLGREYDPLSSEPDWFKTSDVMNEFTLWLEENILDRIKNEPIPSAKIDLFIPKEEIPLPDGFNKIFCFCNQNDLDRISESQDNPENTLPENRYAFLPGYRLLSWGIGNDGTIPEIAYKGFIWCEIGDIPAINHGETPKVNGDYRSYSRGDRIVCVKPNNANKIYIADFSGQNEFRENIHAKNPDQEMLTRKQSAELDRIPARTIIPLNEYKGGFKKPVILIARELSLNEVELVK